MHKASSPLPGKAEALAPLLECDNISRMRRGLLCLLTLAAALPAAARNDPGPPPPPVPEPVREAPPGFICSVSREGPFGAIRAQQSVSPSGAVEAPLFNWSARIGTRGIAMDASWGGPSPGYSLVFLTFDRQEPGRTYRLRLQRRSPAPGETELTLDGALVPSGQDYLYTLTEWGPLAAMLAGAEDPHIIVLDGAGTVVADEVVSLEMFRRARFRAEQLRPQLRPLVAHYRDRCTFYDGGPIPLPSVETP